MSFSSRSSVSNGLRSLSSSQRQDLFERFTPRRPSPFAPSVSSTRSFGSLTAAAPAPTAALRLQQGRLSDEDEAIIVLCSLQTLLSATQQAQFGPNGQPPCEGHFIVLDPVNPRFPIMDKGFVFFPSKQMFRQTKDALASMQLRINTIHAIDPHNAKFSLKRYELQKQATGHTATLVTEKVSDLAQFMDRLFSSVSDEKIAALGTVLFVVDPKRLSETKQALLWMQSQPHTFKFPKIAIKTIQEVFPDIDSPELLALMGNLENEMVSQERDHRCLHHPKTQLNPYGNAFFCCMEEARRSQHRLVQMSDVLEALVAESTQQETPSTGVDGTTNTASAESSDQGPSSGVQDASSSVVQERGFQQGPRHAGHHARVRQMQLVAETELDDDLVCPTVPDYYAIAMKRLREKGLLPPEEIEEDDVKEVKREDLQALDTYPLKKRAREGTSNNDAHRSSLRLSGGVGSSKFNPCLVGDDSDDDDEVNFGSDDGSYDSDAVWDDPFLRAEADMETCDLTLS